MALSELTSREAVLAAIKEYDELGAPNFLVKHGYGPARDYVIEFEGRQYDSKAIAGVAFGHQFPDRGPLLANEFSGGESTVKPVLEKLGFTVARIASTPVFDPISLEDINVLRDRQPGERFKDLSDNEQNAYRRIHSALGGLGKLVVERLQNRGQFSLKLTSSFNPASGVRGALPKDLWFSVSNSRDAELGMPQLFMIVSSRGVELGFAPAIHPRDFSDENIRARVQAAAPRIFAALPGVDSTQARAVNAQLERAGQWYFRRKTRLQPGIEDFPSLAAWLAFLKAPEGGAWAGGSISQYIAPHEIEQIDLVARVESLADVFASWMDRREQKMPDENVDVIRPLLESFLSRFPEVRVDTRFGQHDELKSLMKLIVQGIENLPDARKHPGVRITWSLGAGNWAKVPWVALLDERETDTTQKGIYGVLLFREDMTGVYLTLNQGVTDVINEHGRATGRKFLKDRAKTIRAELASLSEAGFVLDDNINLATEGALGQDYQIGTIAYKLYSKGSVPNDVDIGQDIGRLLDAYTEVLDRRAMTPEGGRAYWIFQANPTRFDIDGALSALSELTWVVRDKNHNPQVSDKVFFWRAGRDAGIVAIGTITSPIKDSPTPTDEQPFVRDLEAYSAILPTVRVHVDRPISPPLLRTTIAAEPRLQDLMILRFAQYGVFSVSRTHAAVLDELLEDQSAPTQTVEQRVWTYAPGKNAEFWDDFYEQGIMAIGWDDLEDLSQFGSIDDILDALHSAYPSEVRQTNNARACFDFVHKLKVGDLVFAKRGRGLILGHGIVTGEYKYVSDRKEYTSLRTVRWESRGEWVTSDQMAVKVLTDVTDATNFVEQLKRLVAIRPLDLPTPVPPIAREPYSIQAALAGLFWPSEELERALRIWRKKKNLILQGRRALGRHL